MGVRFLFHIYPSSGVPIYRQLLDQVRGQVASGGISPGQILPSVRKTAQELQINPMTVSKAYSILEREGVIEFVRGKGMRIKDVPMPESFAARQEVLNPLLDEVLACARKLELTPGEVLDVLKAILEGRTNGK